MNGELKYQLILQNSRYLKELHEARRETRAFDKSTRGAAGGTSMLGSAAVRASSAMSSARLASAGLASGVGYVALRSLKAASSLEKLEMGLAATMGSAEAARDRIAQLRAVARMPGLGFEEAVQGDIRLQAVGFSAERSTRLLLGFGNALATVGGSKAELDGVITALSQMAAKSKVSAEEINQIAERVPQIRRVMADAFGTADTEALQAKGLSVERFVEGVVSELEKLPIAASGAANATENLGDAVDRLFSSLGKPFIGAMTTTLSTLADMAEGAGMAIEAVTGNSGDAAAAMQRAAEQQATAADEARRQAEQLERVQAVSEETKAAARREAYERERSYQIAQREAQLRMEDLRAEDELAAANKRTQEIIFEATLSEPENIQRQIKETLWDARRAIPFGNSVVSFKDLTDARALAAVINRLRGKLSTPARISLAEKLAKLVQLEARLSELKARQADEAAREARNRRETVELQERAAADFALEGRILQARAAGNEKLAAQLERQAAVERLKRQLMRDQGLAAEEALRVARQRIALEDKAEKPATKRGLKSAEESAVARFERMSRADKAKVGDFNGFLARDTTTRVDLFNRARRAGAGAADAGGAPGSRRDRTGNKLETFAQRQHRELAAINRRLADLGLAAV